MAKVYACWAGEGAEFHYLSASPWQLENELRLFLDNSGFPKGPLNLRKARPKSLKTPFLLIAGARDHKIAEPKALLTHFPARTFVLVGDAGEQDPEIYGEIIRGSQKQIERILIRRVKGADHSDARWAKAFAREGSLEDLRRSSSAADRNASTAINASNSRGSRSSRERRGRSRQRWPAAA